MIWVSLTIMICTIVISAACLRSWRWDALGIPVIAIGIFAFIYVIQPVQLIWSDTYRLFLTDWQMSEGILVSALMLACFILGWLLPARGGPGMAAPWDLRAIWNFGFGAACVGLLLYVIFIERSGGFATAYGQAHGHGMAWEKNTAYVYDGPWLMLSGAVMMIFGERKLRTRQWRAFVPYGFLILYLADAIMGGDRSNLFEVMSVALLGHSIARRRRVDLWQAFGVMLVAGIAIIIVFSNRDRIHLGEEDSGRVQSSSEAFNGLVGTSELDREHGTTGQEFLYHAVELATVDKTGKLDYGVGWIEFLVINPIPKLLWPEKAYPPSPGINWADIQEQTSLRISSGSAPGIVGDLYIRFHLLSALFFFGLGFALRRLFIAACNLVSPVAAVAYVMVYAVSLMMFAQGFGAIFVPMAYSMAPVLLYSWFTSESRKKAGERQRQLIAHQLAALRQHAAVLHEGQWLS